MQSIVDNPRPCSIICVMQDAPERLMLRLTDIVSGPLSPAYSTSKTEFSLIEPQEHCT